VLETRKVVKKVSALVILASIAQQVEHFHGKEEVLTVQKNLGKSRVYQQNREVVT
jgi:hypothetical protein